MLCVTALGDSVELAQQRAYEAVDAIRFDGMQYRRDIGSSRDRSRRQRRAERGTAMNIAPFATTSTACRRASSRGSEALDGKRFPPRRMAAARGRRRRLHAHPRRRQPLRARRRQLLARDGHALPPSATRGAPELAGPRLRGDGRVARAASAQSRTCPTVHMNVRFFARRRRRAVWWFGGGMDLTPYYGFEEDARHFHRTCRDALAPFGDELYPRFKTLVRRILLPAAPQRAARHRRHLLRRSCRARISTPASR